MPLTPEETDRHVGKKLREIRESAGLTQEALARELGCDSETVIQIENGQRSVTAEELWNMCVILDVSPSRFFVEND